MRFLLLGLVGLLVTAALAAWVSGRPWSGVIALAVTFVPWTAWAMSGDLDVESLLLVDGRLTIAMRRRREEIDVRGATFRRLTPPEIEHLEGLATAGGITAGSGGFDSRLLGEFDLYASDFRNAILCEVGEERFVFTPDDPDALLAAFDRSASDGVPRTSSTRPVAAHRAPPAWHA